MVISHSILLRMKNVSERFVDKSKAHFIFGNFLFENCAVHEIIWKEFVEPDEPQMTIWCRCIVCWIPTMRGC